MKKRLSLIAGVLLSGALASSVALGQNLNYTGSGTFGGQLIGAGTTTNDSACTGCIGEFQTATLTSGQLLTTGSPADVVSLSLTAGDWECRGQTVFIGNGTTSMTQVATWTSTTEPKTAFPGISVGNNNNPSLTNLSIAATTSGNFEIPTAPMRYSLASTTTVWLGALSTFTASVNTNTGNLSCRRVR